MASIMIVDDSNYTRRTHRRILESDGHTVLEAASGMAAIESYFVHQPDVVLLDLTMEDMSGLEVLQQLRAMQAGARVIVVSAETPT
jgi:two-component system chemotaxis response regulator CheY